jgi:hypothetical protein
LFVSAALLLLATADIHFTNISLFGAFESLPIASPLYNAGNLTFVGEILWYIKFGMYDQGMAAACFGKETGSHR